MEFSIPLYLLSGNYLYIWLLKFPCYFIYYYLAEFFCCLSYFYHWLIIEWVLQQMITSPTSFTFSFWIVFSCLIALASSANTMLKSNGDSEFPWLILDLGENASSVSPLSKMLTLGLTYINYVKEVSIHSYSWVFLLGIGVEFLSEGCSAFLKILWFSSYTY